MTDLAKEGLVKPTGWSLAEWGSRNWWSTFGILITTIVFAMVVLPVFFLIAGAFSTSGQAIDFSFTLDHVNRVLSDPRVFRLLLNSAIFSVGAMLVAGCISVPIAWFIERTNVRHKSLLRLLVLCTTGVSGLLKALGWSLLASPQIGLLNAIQPFVQLNIYSMPGMIFVQGMAFVPLMFLMVSPAMRNVDASLEEAAIMSRARLPYVIRRILVALVRPSLLAACLYLFIIGLLTFEIPALLGVRAKIYVLSSEIYFSTANMSVPQFGYASAISVVVMVVGLLAAMLYLWSLRQSHRFVTVTGKLRAGGLDIGRWRWLCYAWLGGYFLINVVLPIGAITWTSLLPYFSSLSLATLSSLSLSNYTMIFSSPRIFNAFSNTLIIATTTATAGTILAALVSWFVVRSGVKWRGPVDLLAFIPLLVPGIAMGLGIRAGILSMPFIPIYGTIWIIALANIIDSLPFATRNLNGSLVQVHPELEEAGVMSRGSQLYVFRRILLPIVLPSVAFVWLWTFVGTMRDFSMAVMLYSPRSQVASTLLFNYYEQSDFTAAAAVGVVFFLLVFPLTVAVLTWVERARGRVGLM